MKHVLLILLFLTECLIASSQSQLTNLPTFYINTVNKAPITSTDIYVPGFLTVVSSDTSEVFKADTIEIRGRGNSTWNFAKKPYRIKFEKKRKLLNMHAKAKSWVLLANHADKTLIRNAVAFEIGKFLGMEFTPSVRFADVVLNGVFLGNYMVTDQVEVGGDRVEVDKQDSTDITEPNITGGYLLEIDGFASLEPLWFSTGKGVDITMKYPDEEDINVQQLNYIKNFTNSFETTLFSETYTDQVKGYRTLIDTTSFIDWYIASELTGNPDCFWSTYLYKKRNIQKFFYGPLWDYDIAFNNDNRLGDALQKRMLTYAFQNKTWITRQSTDAWFINKVNQRWDELLKQGIVTHLNNYVDSLNILINQSQTKNFEKWPVLNTRVYNEQFLFPTYIEGVNFLKKYIEDRASFLTTSFAQDEPVVPGKPFVAENFYYMIMNKSVLNVIDIKDLSAEVNAKLVLWDPVEGRLTQQWKIMQLSDNKFQLLNRFSGLAMKSGGRGKNLIQVKSDTTSAEQQWQILPESSGTAYGLVNVKSGYTADCSGGSSANGTAVIEWDIKTSGADNQYWYIQKVEMLETSLDQPSDNLMEITMYPNPVQETLYLSRNGSEVTPMIVEIYSTQGRLMHREQCADNDARIDVSGLPQGLYLLKATLSGKSYIKKFQKK
jgi:hypothetical protein